MGVYVCMRSAGEDLCCPENENRGDVWQCTPWPSADSRFCMYGLRLLIDNTGVYAFMHM